MIVAAYPVLAIFAAIVVLASIEAIVDAIRRRF